MESFGVGERRADVRAGQVGRLLHRLEEHPRSIIGLGGEGIGKLPAVLLLELADELLDARARVVHRVVVGEVAAFECGAADLVQLLAVPAVSAEERYGDADLARLPRDQADVRVVAGNVERVGLRRFHVGELRLEVDVAVRVALGGDDLPAHLLDVLLEVLGEAHRVVVAHVLQDRELLQLQVVGGELRHHVALEGIDEAGAEDVVAFPGHLRVGGGGRDHRDLGRLRLVRHEHAAGGGDLAEERDHVLAGDEAGRGGGGLFRLALVVEGDDLDLPVLDAARAVYLLDAHLDAAVAGDAEGRLGTGHAADLADLDRTVGCGARCPAAFRLLRAG